MTKGRAATMTHDSKQNGTTTLFAALDVLTGTVIEQCLPRHRHEKFLKFLRTIEREVPAGVQVHLICDNYATRQHPAVGGLAGQAPPLPPAFHPDAVLMAQPRRTLVSGTADKAPRRGVFHSVSDLIAKLEEYLAAHNDDPKPLRLDPNRRRRPRQSRPRTRRTASGQSMTRHTTRTPERRRGRPAGHNPGGLGSSWCR